MDLEETVCALKPLGLENI